MTNIPSENDTATSIYKIAAELLATVMAVLKVTAWNRGEAHQQSRKQNNGVVWPFTAGHLPKQLMDYFFQIIDIDYQY